MESMFEGATSANPDVSKWNTWNVTSMESMFKGATSANPDVSNWSVSDVREAHWMFANSGIVKADLSKWSRNKGYYVKMFENCHRLEYLKTPAGLLTNISGADNDFKIVRLEYERPVTVEAESKNLKEEFTVGYYEEAISHVYRKDKYVGVTFDKNGGDSEAWVNHEIVEKGKSIKDCNGKMPSSPGYAMHEFLGWSKNKDDNTSIFDENAKVDKDTTAYALWKQKVNITFDGNGGQGSMDAVQVDKNGSYTLPESLFTPPDGLEFDKWSVKVGNAQPVEKKPGESIVASDNVTVAAKWTLKVDKVNVRVAFCRLPDARYSVVSLSRTMEKPA